MEHTETKHYLITALKVAVACILIWFLFKNGRLRTETLLRLFHFESLPFLILSAFAFLCSQALSSIRMMFLLKAIELRIAFFPIFKLTMIGNFFNMIIPGTVGGDIFKGVCLTRQEGSSKGRSSGIVVIDRAVGLIALCLLGFASAMYVAYKYGSVLFPYRFELWTAITLSFVIVASFVLFVLISKYEPVRQKIGRIVLKLFPKGFFYNAFEGFALITKKRRYLSYALLISLVAQGISLAGLLNLLNVTEEVFPDLVPVVAASSIVMLLGVVPLTPGNIGWTELLATFGWAAVGAKGGGDVFLSWRIITALCSLTGALFYLLPSRSIDNHPRKADMAV